MRDRIVRAACCGAVGLGLLLATSALPGCGESEIGADGAAEANAANPKASKSDAADPKTGIVGPKGRKGMTPPGAQ